MSSGSYTSKLAQILKLKKCAAWEPVWYMYTRRWLIWLWYNRSHNCKTIDYKLKIKKYILSTSRNKLEYGIQMKLLSFLHFDFQKQMFCLFVKLLNTFDSHIRSAYRVVSLLSIITHMLTRDALYSTFWYSKSCSQKIDTILLQLWIFIKHIEGKVGENTYWFQRIKFQHTCIKKTLAELCLDHSNSIKGIPPFLALKKKENMNSVFQNKILMYSGSSLYFLFRFNFKSTSNILK